MSVWTSMFKHYHHYKKFEKQTKEKKIISLFADDEFLGKEKKKRMK